MNRMTLNQKVFVSDQLERTMAFNNVSTTALGTGLSYTQSWASKLKNGKIPLQFDSIEGLKELLPKQSELLFIELANKITGIIPPVANGDGLDQSAIAFASRTRREINEATKAFEQACDELESKPEFVRDTSDVTNLVNQLFDVLLMTQSGIAIFCNQFCLNAQSLEQKREQYWKAEHLTK